MKSLSSLRGRVAASAATTLIVAASLGAAAAPAYAQGTACGSAPTGYNVIESNDATIVGTAGNDFICAGNSANDIQGKSGDDIIFGRGGDDTVDGGQGDDVIRGGSGDDILRGGNKTGADVIDGEAGNDSLRGLGGPDQLFGGPGDDKIQGGGGSDQIFGGDGNDILKGKPGGDTINGEAGEDNIQAGSGNDTVNGGEDDDVLVGGKGNDLLDGSTGDDILKGNDGDDELYGGSGNDKVVGGSGNDTMGGDAGTDDLDGQGGTDSADGGADTDTCIAETRTNCELPVNDADGDGVLDADDNCPQNSNPNQENLDGDALGDACDPDDDGDTVPDTVDNCPADRNGSQGDLDGDGEGDVCDLDDDGDGVPDATDNCPVDANADQADGDGDGIGNACDDMTGDLDLDGVPDALDNTPNTYFVVNRFADVSSVGGWTPNGTVTVTVTGSAAQTVTCNANANGDLGMLDDSGNVFITACVLLPVPLGIGDVVTATDDTDGAVKTVTVSLEITKVERWSETVFGNAPAGSTVEVIAKGNNGASAPVMATADGAGMWSADFSALPFDIDAMNGALVASATLVDAEADVEATDFNIDHAGIAFDAASGAVTPVDNFDFAPGVQVTIELLDTDGTTVLETVLANTNAITGNWSGTLVGPFATGMTVRVTDPGTTDVLTVAVP